MAISGICLKLINCVQKAINDWVFFSLTCVIRVECGLLGSLSHIFYKMVTANNHKKKMLTIPASVHDWKILKASNKHTLPARPPTKRINIRLISFKKIKTKRTSHQVSIMNCSLVDFITYDCNIKYLNKHTWNRTWLKVTWTTVFKKVCLCTSQW